MLPPRAAGLAIATLCVALGGQACTRGNDDLNLPFIRILDTGLTKSGDVEFEYIVRDQDGRFVNIIVEVIDQDLARPATAAPGSPSTVGLKVSSFGESFRFIWDSRADLGVGVFQDRVLRFTGVGGDGLGLPSETIPFTVDNSDGFRAPRGGNAPLRSGAVSSLTGDGRALLALGRDAANAPTRDSFLYDAELDAFVAGPELARSRDGAALARVSEGLLLCGGREAGVLLADAELLVFDPNTPNGRAQASAPLARPRDGLALTTLADGRALVSGGDDDQGPVDTIELFSAGAFSTVAQDPRLARRQHSVTQLLDGRLLIAGGQDLSGALASALLVSVDAAGVATLTSTPDLATARSEQAALLLEDGRVLLAGGRDSGGSALASLELYDPTSNTFQPLGFSAQTARIAPIARLIDGEVLLEGGEDTNGAALQDAELLDRVAGVSRPSRFSPLGASRGAAAFALGNGEVLRVGGGATPELYFPQQAFGVESFLVGEVVTSPRADHVVERFGVETFTFGGRDGISGLASEVVVTNTSTSSTERRGALLTGRVEHATARQFGSNFVRFLVIGGRDAQGPTASCELYDAVTGLSRLVGALQQPRTGHAAVLLPDSEVLVFGGRDASGTPLASAELYDPLSEQWRSVGSLGTARAEAAVAIIDSNSTVLVAGGLDQNGLALASAELYDPQLEVFRAAQNSMSIARRAATLSVDSDFRFVAVAGGDDGATAQASFELFDVGAERFDSTRPLNLARSGGRAVRISGGRSLLIGGRSGLVDAPPELLILGDDPLNGFGALPLDPTPLLLRRDFGVDSNGFQAFIHGGRDRAGVVLPGFEIFIPGL